MTISPLKAIRKHCLDCGEGSANEVKLCPVTRCALYPFRFGKNPYRAKRELSEERKQAMAENLRKYREEKSKV